MKYINFETGAVGEDNAVDYVLKRCKLNRDSTDFSINRQSHLVYF